MKESDYYPKEVWKLATNISISSFIYCFSLVSMNSCTDNIAETLKWDSSAHIRSIFSTIYPVGSMIGSLLGNQIASHIGIRSTIIYSNIVFILSSLICIIPMNYTFAIGRLFTGIVGGIFITIPAVFINEITPDPMTGPVGTLIQQACSIAFLSSYMLGLLVPTEDLSSSFNYIWMLIIIFPSIMSLYQLIYFTFIFKYENPKWLLNNKKENEARQALKKIYKDHSVDLGLKRLIEQHPTSDNKEETLLCTTPTFKQMLCSKTYRKMMRISLALNIGQQTAGSVTVLMYSTSMFEDIGGGKFFARLMTVVMGFTVLLAGISSVFFLNYFGRKTIMTIGTLLSSICLVCLGYFSEGNGASVVASSIFIFTYIFMFTISMGATYWTYIAEVCNEKSISIGLTINFITVIIFSFLFPIITSYQGISFSFYLLSAFAFSLFIYQEIDLIETKGLTKEEIRKQITSY